MATTYKATAHPGGQNATGLNSPIIVTGLTNGQAYTFTVVASNEIGDSPESGYSSSVIPASAPEKITSVTPTRGDGQVSVAFNTPNNGGKPISGFVVTASPGGVTTSGSSSPILVTGLTNGIPYTFTVSAINEIGTGTPSDPTAAVTPSSVPPAPTGVVGSATLVNYQISVAFTPPASNGGTPIDVYMVTSTPGGYTATGAGSPILITLPNGDSRTYKVKAHNSVGYGVESAASAGITPKIPVLLAPTNPTFGTMYANADYIEIGVTKPVDDGGSPILYYECTGDEGIVTSGNTSYDGNTFYVYAQVRTAGSHSFQIRAVTALGKSPPLASGSRTFSFTVHYNAAPPQSLWYDIVNSAGYNCVALYYSAPEWLGVDPKVGDYGCLYRNPYTGNAVYETYAQVPATQRGPGTSGPAYGEAAAYAVRVKTSPGAGTRTSQNSAAVVVTCAAQMRPNVPINPVATGVYGGCSLTCTAPYNCGSAITAYSAVSSPGGYVGTSPTLPVIVNCPPGSYTFTMTATNAIGTSGASRTSSNSATALSPTAPDAPTIGTASIDDQASTVSFTPPGNNGGSVITSYTVVTEAGGFSVSGASSPITVTGLTNGVAYTFKVKATNAYGDSAWSGTVVATPRVPSVPSAPQPISVGFDYEAAYIQFSAPTDNGGRTITSYTVTASPGNITATGVSTGIMWVYGLTGGQAYTLTVKATNSIGTGPDCAAQGPVTPMAFTAPSAPRSASAAAGSNDRCTVSFLAPSSNGGSTITNYTATSSPGGFTGSASYSPITVTGLTVGTYYTFTVTATNGTGTGPASNETNSVTPVAQTGPPAPQGVSWSNYYGNMGAIFITAPASGSPFLYYILEDSVTGQQWSSDGADTTLYFSCGAAGIPGSRPFTLKAVNASGIGAALTFTFGAIAGGDLPALGSAPDTIVGGVANITATALAGGQALIAWNYDHNMYYGVNGVPVASWYVWAYGNGQSWNYRLVSGEAQHLGYTWPSGLVAGVTYRFAIVVIEGLGTMGGCCMPSNAIVALSGGGGPPP